VQEARSLPRRRVFLGEGLAFEIRTTSGAAVAAEVIDVTSAGLGLALAEPLAAGERVHVRYTGPGASGESVTAVVRHVGSLRRGDRLIPRAGLELDAVPAARERACAVPAFATADCPWFFREPLRLRIAAAGARRMTLVGDAPLLPGAELDFTLCLGHVGTVAARARIAGPDGRGRVCATWIEPGRELLEALARHLLAGDPTLTPAALRASGLAVASVAREVTFDCARTAADREEILALRLRAHRAEGHLDGITLDDLRSPYDAHARHLTCRAGGRIVGYVRVIFVDRDPARSQYVSLGGHAVPPWLWRAGFAEAGAGAMDPGFQRSGLFVPLMAHALRVAVQSGHRYVLGACEDGLLGMYEAMGFTRLEQRIVEPKPGWSFRSHLILLDAEALAPDTPALAEMAAAAAFAKLSENVLERPAQRADRGRQAA
jgi:hypothetical protein